MFKLGASTGRDRLVSRSLSDRVWSAGAAAMAYWFYRWDWGEAIAIDGLWAAGTSADQAPLTDFAATETTRWLRSARAGDLDPMGPVDTAMELLERGLLTDPHALLPGLVRLADHIVSVGDEVGGISPHGPDPTLFVDSLYGFPAFLFRLGRLTGNDDLGEHGLGLTLEHCRRVQDEHTGLFAHYADAQGPAATTAWGRGNGWAVLGLSDLLTLVPRAHPIARELRAQLLTALDALRPLQTGGGWWRNVLDEPASYPEASTTAMIEAAINQAVKAQIIDHAYQSMADAAWHAVQHRIDTNGHLVGVSYRPGVNDDPRRYEHTPAVGSYPWGQGAYLRSAAQRMHTDATDQPVQPKGNNP